MRNLIIFSLFALVTATFAGTKEYIPGTGSEFKFTSENGEKVNLSIYITESSFSRLGVEYFFSTNGLIQTQVWQQFIMGIADSGLSLDNGYVLSSDMKVPEIMTKEFRENNDNGVNVQDFFFSQSSEIEKFKIGVEKIEVPAGSITTIRYQKKRGDQTVDFWISDKAGAIGLVKLVSKGKPNSNHNYKIELATLLKNVKAKINPKEAVPLTDKGRMFLKEKK
jgi:hypothetical protein